jgi:hypothetical protein
VFVRLARAFVIAACFASIVIMGAGARGDGPAHPATPLPPRLSETGLYAAGSTTTIRSGNIAFSPQYPLWSDGAAKRRWLHIPPGMAIDASQPDEWDFPPGTKLWKAFSHGRRVETRLIERLPDRTWRYATYVWNDEGTDAMLAPATGISALPVSGAPGGRYAIPSEGDCRACHEGAAVPILGASALQLSADRDPLAPHAEPRRPGDADLRELVARGWLRNLSPALLESPPRIAAPSPMARAALGYLHANCGHCHNNNGAPPPVDLVLSQSAQANESGYAKFMRSLVGAPTRYRAPETRASATLIDAGRPETSVLLARMRSRDPRVQMPPLGTQIGDTEALEVLERWIRSTPQTRKESHP